MKTTQRGIIAVSGTLSVIALISYSLASHGQSDSQSTADAILQPVAPGNIPQGAAFFYLSDYLNNGGSLGGPYPFLKNTNAAVYALNVGTLFLVDDTSMTNDAEALNALALLLQPQDTFSANLFNGTTSGMMTMDSADSSGSFSADSASFPTNVLWIQVPTNSLAVAGTFSAILQNTAVDQEYDVLTTTNLTLPLSNWVVEQSVLGVEGTNCTPVTLMINGRSNLFVTARFGGSSDGSGLPDWWEQQYFPGVTNGIDPFMPDSSGDGWNLLDDFQNGWVPGSWHTPPPPQNFSVTVDSTGTNFVMTWQSGGGPVVHYDIEETDQIDPPFDEAEVGADTFTFTDKNYDSLQLISAYPRRVVAVFTNGDRSPSAWKWPIVDRSAILFRGPGGQYFLALANAPQNLAGVNLVTSIFPLASEYISATNVVNGIVQVPQDLQLEVAEGSLLWVQLVDSNGNSSDYISPTGVMNIERYGTWPVATNFANASVQMKENLKFLFRAAGVLWPFGYSSGLSWNDSLNPPWVQADPSGFDAYNPEQVLARGTVSSNYEYYGYHTFSPGLKYSLIDELRPVRENFLWRNFIYNPIDFTNDNGTLRYSTAGGTNGGVSWDDGIDNLRQIVDVAWPTINWAKYEYTGTGTETPLPIAFDSSDSSWIFHTYELNPANLGIYPSQTNANVDILGSGVANIYGLALQSAYSDTNFVSPGSIFPENNNFYPFENFVEPNLQIVDYYFASQTPFFNFVDTNVSAGTPYSYTGPPSVLPGSPAFSTTNTSPLLITGVGQPITVSGWEKMALANGNPNTFGYLEQYFDFGQAFQIGTNGLPTTNSAGMLSPYGDFFPTMPGPAALITMLDTNSNQRGTSVVNVVKLQLDVNHDRTMDLSFGGPDNTSPAKPMIFWLNNDSDGTGIGDGVPTNNVDRPNYVYGKIRSWRNLENFQRLWVCGLPKLPASQGYAAVLTMTPITGNPAINLYVQSDSAGSDAYLTDTNAAAGQFDQQFLNGFLYFDYSTNFGTVGSNQSLQLPVLTVDGTLPYTNFLFEGAGLGVGRLTLSIWQTNSQGTNIIAQTSAWLDIHDLKEFYERTVITNNMSSAISNWTSGIDSVKPAASSILGDDTNIIVLVHGINVPVQNWFIEGDTVLKRLYWAKFRGKLAIVKWPCNFFDWSLLTNGTTVFNQSEVKAYKGNPSLASYISNLRERYPGYHVHLLVHSQGNAITSEAIEKSGLQFDTYILTQGALPASSYDANAILTNTLLTAENGYQTPQGQPFGYVGMYTNLPGRIVNFYNSLDPVLNWWVFDQRYLKPDGYAQNQLLPTDYYSYNSPFGYFNDHSGLTKNLVLDPEESRAMIARSLTWPIGQYGYQSTQSVIKTAVDLHARFGFANSSFDDHSAQWAWPIQETLPYYDQILTEIGPQQ
jgi:hypothetical protein